MKKNASAVLFGFFCGLFSLLKNFIETFSCASFQISTSIFAFVSHQKEFPVESTQNQIHTSDDRESVMITLRLLKFSESIKSYKQRHNYLIKQNQDQK